MSLVDVLIIPTLVSTNVFFETLSLAVFYLVIALLAVGSFRFVSWNKSFIIWVQRLAVKFILYVYLIVKPFVHIINIGCTQFCVHVTVWKRKRAFFFNIRNVAFCLWASKLHQVGSVRSNFTPNWGAVVKFMGWRKACWSIRLSIDVGLWDFFGCHRSVPAGRRCWSRAQLMFSIVVIRQDVLFYVLVIGISIVLRNHRCIDFILNLLNDCGGFLIFSAHIILFNQFNLTTIK